jgi:hypothetical protein
MEEFEGHVVREPFATGSKSAHRAVQLATADRAYVLRRPGGHAFHDPALEALVGKRIRATGKIRGHTLFLTEWHEEK